DGAAGARLAVHGAPRRQHDDGRGQDRHGEYGDPVAHEGFTDAIIRDAARSFSAASAADGLAAWSFASRQATSSSNGARRLSRAEGGRGSSAACDLNTSATSPVKGAWPVSARPRDGRARARRLAHARREVEVEELRVSARVYQQVLRLDVAVHDAAVVEVAEALGHGGQGGEALGEVGALVGPARVAHAQD